MKIQPQYVSEILLITPKRFDDDRGYFMETFRQDIFQDHVKHTVNFVQSNHSLSRHAGTVRGLHYQSPPHAQGKLVRCTQGRIVDIAVDVRLGSETYGHSVRAALSAENGQQLWIPEGFLHGFVTQEPNTEVQYKCTDYYVPACDGSVLWNDSDLSLDWGIDNNNAILSKKDAQALPFAEFKSPFLV